MKQLKKEEFKIVWVGVHMEGIDALRAILEAGYNVAAVFTLKPELAARRSGAVDYSIICKEFQVPLYKISSINSLESIKLLNSLSPDIVFVIGWNEIVKPEVLKIPKIGMIGAHASLLPHNRGSAPINWAIIKGEKVTGNSLIWLINEVDKGSIIAQRSFKITPYDTCFSLYKKVAETNKEMIMELLPKLIKGERPAFPQPYTKEPLLPRRRPQDGIINWSLTAQEIYNFIRALTRPYPGAFSWLDGKKWYIWQAALLPENITVQALPGEIIGSVYSPIEEACGQVVACGKGCLLILEIEDEKGVKLKGRELSEESWKGKIWRNE